MEKCLCCGKTKEYFDALVQVQRRNIDGIAEWKRKAIALDAILPLVEELLEHKSEAAHWHEIPDETIQKFAQWREILQ